MRVRFALSESADSKPHEDATSMSSWSMCDRIEYEASQFLRENHQRILGPVPFYAVHWQEKIHLKLRLEAFKELSEIYAIKVQALLRVKARTEHLRRSAQALISRKAKSLVRFYMDRMAEEVLRELKAKEAEEKEILEDVSDVAKDILKLGRADLHGMVFLEKSAL